MARFTFSLSHKANGDDYYHAHDTENNNKNIGIVRHNPRVNQYHAVFNNKSKHFGTKHSAANWLVKQHAAFAAKRAAQGLKTLSMYDIFKTLKDN